MAIDETPVTSSLEPRNLRDYVALFWRFKAAIVVVVVAAGLAAFLFSLFTPRTFESTVTFAASHSKLGDANLQPASTAAFRPMVESLTTAAAVIRDFGLEKPPHNLTPSSFLERVMVVKEVRGTNLLTVRIANADPLLAATIANRVADHAVQTARRVSASEASRARDLIKEQLDLARGQLDASQAALTTFRQNARVEAIRRDVEVRLGGPQSSALAPRSQPQVQPRSGTNSPQGPVQSSVAVLLSEAGASRDGLLEIGVAIAGEKARIQAAEQQLASRQKGDPLRDVLEESLATMRAGLAARERQRAAVMSGYTLDPGTAKLLTQLHVVEGELARHELERTVAQLSYTDLSQQYQDAMLQVIGRSADFVIIDPAVPADRPVSRQVARNTMLAMVVMTLLAMAAVIMWDSASRRPVSRS
jgi:uncharacterized protein involved in exopolysaccharide biosynthesis